MTRFKPLFVLLLFSGTAVFGQVRINEFLSNSSGGLADEDGESHDWIELYNAGKETINLEGYSLTDNSDSSRKWVFPKRNLKAEEFLIIFASGKDRLKGKKLHTNFAINSKGESILLYNSQNQLIDSTAIVPLAKNRSYARIQDGKGYFKRSRYPSPGRSNMERPEVIFSALSGFYKDSLSLELSARSDYQIYYTLDGSIPTTESELYKAPILITNQKSTPADIGYSDSRNERIDETPYQKATIIRAALFDDTSRVSTIYTETYLVTANGKDRYSGIDLISLVMTPEDLLGYDSGIYAYGKHGQMKKGDANFYQRGRAWERNGSMTYFKADGQLAFSQNVGVRIHGGAGRVKSQKSFRIYAREEYGAHYLNYPFFENRNHQIFKRIVLRHTMGDPTGSMIKDEFLAAMARELNVEVLESRAVVLFLNGHYWGLYHIREYFDANFIASNYQIPSDSVNIVLHGYGNREEVDEGWGMIEGDGSSMLELYEFLRHNSLESVDNYASVCSILNIESIIDYYCLEVFLNNLDWPSNNNKLWSVGNGKWSQVLFDVDRTCLGEEQNSLSYLIESKERKQCAPYATLLFRKLIESEQFVQRFAERMKYIIEVTFEKNRVRKMIQGLADRLKPYVPEHTSRWSGSKNKARWLSFSSTGRIEAFLSDRPKFIKQFLLSELGIEWDSIEMRE